MDCIGGMVVSRPGLKRMLLGRFDREHQRISVSTRAVEECTPHHVLRFGEESSAGARIDDVKVGVGPRHVALVLCKASRENGQNETRSVAIFHGAPCHYRAPIKFPANEERKGK
jgi:hypothetical protein